MDDTKQENQHGFFRFTFGFAICLVLVLSSTSQSAASRLSSVGSATGIAAAQGPVSEYVDNTFQFAFQFPPDWKIEKVPAKGDAEGIRVIVRHATKPMYVMATVGQLGKAITKAQFESSPNRSAAVEAMIDISLQQVYKKTSLELHAEQMIVTDRRALPSDSGIKFYISTLHTVDALPMLVSGIHVVPFGKPYLIAFVMVAPVDRSAKTDNDTITRVFNSFHMVGDAPLQ